MNKGRGTKKNTRSHGPGSRAEDADLTSFSSPASLQPTIDTVWETAGASASAASSVSSAGAAKLAASQTDPTTSSYSQNMDVILQRLDAMNARFDGVLQAISEVKADVRGFSSRMDEAERRISDVEDTVTVETSKISKLAQQIDDLTSKLDEMENRSRRCNLRLVNLPPVEGDDPVGYITKWLPEALGATTFPTPLIIEAAHRLPGRRRQTNPNRPPPPKVFILKFLNFQDKIRAMKAAKEKKKVMCGNHQVMFFSDLSAELHRRRRKFDPVKQQLKSLNIHYGLFFPAKLRVWINGRTREFETPKDAEKFVQDIQDKNMEGGTQGENSGQAADENTEEFEQSDGPHEVSDSVHSDEQADGLQETPE